MRGMRKLLVIVLGLFILTSTAAAAPAAAPKTDSGILMDTVVATVDEKPITLRDLEHRLRPPRKITLDQAAHDEEAQQTLDRMIFEQAIYAEAAEKKINVEEGDIDRYIDAVAQKNNLSRDGLVKALQEEKKDMAQYREEIKIEIMQTRLGAMYLQSHGAVTQEEVEKYLQEHPELTQGGSQLKLNRIIVSTANRSEDEAKSKAEEALKRIKGGDSFGTVAHEMSDGPEAKEDGSLGLVAEKDLSPAIFDATLKLSKGDISDVIKTEDGYQIFQVEDRIASGEANKAAIEDEVKKRLRQDKEQNKIQSFFTTELYKNHTIEKKI